MATLLSKAAATLARKRVRSQSPERRKEIAKQAAAARWAKYRAERAIKAP